MKDKDIVVLLTVPILCLVIGLAASCGESKRRDNPDRGNDAVKVATKFVIPTDITSFLDHVDALRDFDGGIRFEGKIRLPRGTLFILNLNRPGNERILGGDKFALSDDTGTFRTGAFTDHGKPIKEGKYKIELIAHFDEPWQQPDRVIEVAGRYGTKLPRNLSVPRDREFPDRERYIEIETVVTLPPLSPEAIAVQAVKNAKLVVPEHGRATDNVEFIVTYALRGLRGQIVGWTAKRSGNNTWEVTLQYLIDNKKYEAKWEYDSNRRQVKYLNFEAKVFSWLPRE